MPTETDHDENCETCKPKDHAKDWHTPRVAENQNFVTRNGLPCNPAVAHAMLKDRAEPFDDKRLVGVFDNVELEREDDDYADEY